MKQRTVKSSLSSLLVVAGLALCKPVLADTPPAQSAASVQSLAEEGNAYFRQRDYRHANEKYQQAYAIDPDPNLLYNIAKCYEALGDKQVAIEKYELFINSPGSDSAGRVRARAAVEILKTPPAPTPAVKPATTTSATDGKADTTRDSKPVSNETSGPSSIPMVTAFAVGGVGLAVGTIFGLMATSKQSDLDKVCAARACPPSSSSDVSALKTNATTSTIGFAVGGAGVLTGVVLWLVRGKGQGSDAAATTAVMPFVGPTSAGLTGRF